MGHAVKWLGLLAATAAIMPLAEIPGFFKKPWNLIPPALAQSVKDRKAEADRFLQQGLQEFNANQFSEAVQSWERALEIYREIGDRSNEGRTLDDIGSAYFRQSNYSRAIYFYGEALRIAVEIGDERGEAITLTNMGSTLEETNRVNEAIDLFGQALLIFELINDPEGQKIRNFSITAGKPADVELGRGLPREQRSGLTKE